MELSTAAKAREGDEGEGGRGETEAARRAISSLRNKEFRVQPAQAGAAGLREEASERARARLFNALLQPYRKLAQLRTPFITYFLPNMEVGRVLSRGRAGAGGRLLL